MMERLQKIISAAGITSRRASEEMILAGRLPSTAGGNGAGQQG
jgi:16S rRNA U516 pseudouridylate synthase RsuA-like enzyme